jgi:hypothetical protein
MTMVRVVAAILVTVVNEFIPPRALENFRIFNHKTIQNPLHGLDDTNKAYQSCYHHFLPKHRPSCERIKIREKKMKKKHENELIISTRCN